MWGNSSGPGFTAGDGGGEVSDVRTLGQRPLWCLCPVNTLADECGWLKCMWRFCFVPSLSRPLFLALQLEGFITVTRLYLSFSLLCSVVFNLNLAVSFSGLLWIQTCCQSIASSLPCANQAWHSRSCLVWEWFVWQSLSWLWWCHRWPQRAGRTCHVTGVLKLPWKSDRVHWA